jgi:hypothetical protein
MLLCLPITIYSTVIGDRFGYYLMIPQAIMLSRYKELFDGWESRIFAIIPIAILGSMLFFWSQYSNIFQICYGTYNYWVPFTGYTA